MTETVQFPILQSRWSIETLANGESALIYFGLRNYPKQLDGRKTISSGLANLLEQCNGSTSLADLSPGPAYAKELSVLINDGIVVDKTGLRPESSPEKMTSCTRCVNNDYILPGLEFDGNGLCAFCQCYEKAQEQGLQSTAANEISEQELLDVAKNNTRSRYDVMALCTGGKDSTYLLWFLAKKLGLRVLAVSWNMPYTNDTSRENLRRSVQQLPTVELVERTLPWDVIQRAMRKQFGNIGLPCLCPSVAHVLFYPMAVEEKIPFIMQGVEEVQLAVMNYVLSEIQTDADASPTEKPSLRDQTLGFLEIIAKPPATTESFAYNQAFLAYQKTIRDELDPYYQALDSVIANARKDSSMQIPELRRLRTNESYGTWGEVADLVKKEMGWQMPTGQKGLLHTSCRIEKVKDFCQFRRFQNMRTMFYPQSIVELSAGVFFGLIGRDEAKEELAELGYWHEPDVLAPLLADLQIEEQDIDDPEREIGCALRCNCSCDH